ncbi:MAG TPA: alternative ribosome rescue aminoacyl-tRNA hydrolase ArfB [Abditibacterium sp.]|jgi:ribosome-associated protein
MIPITPQISLRDDEIGEEFVRSSGAGGQNVNKVASAVQLRFDVAASPSLSPEIKARLTKIAGKKMTEEGVLIIKAQTHRTQERNRQDALERLVALVREAIPRPVVRVATKPTRGSKERRLGAKRLQSARKAARREVDGE